MAIVATRESLDTLFQVFANWLWQDERENNRTPEDVRRNVEVFLNALLPGSDPDIFELRLVGEIDNVVIEEMLAVAERELDTLIERTIGPPEICIGLVTRIVLPPGTNVIILLTEA